jgi:hypothetical protein
MSGGESASLPSAGIRCGAVTSGQLIPSAIKSNDDTEIYSRGLVGKTGQYIALAAVSDASAMDLISSRLNAGMSEG